MANKSKTTVTQFDPADVEREELTYDVKTRHDHYTEDTLADPEGVAARQEHSLYPEWVFNDYTVSKLNIWGKPNEDGKEHLVATASTIDSIMRLHDAGMQSELIAGMVDLASGEHSDTIDTLIDNYTNILHSLSGKSHYAVVKGVGDAATSALAERAYRKHLFISATGRVRDTEAELPPYVEKLQEQMWEAAIDAGVWYKVHNELWSHLQWKGAPKYYVQNDVKLRLVNAAKYIENNHRAVQPIKASTADHKQMAINF